MDNNQHADDSSSLQKQVKELVERIEKLENSEIHHENKGTNDKLSNYAYKAIQGSRGPLKPDELLKYFTDDVFGKKEALAVIRKFPNNIDGVKNQFSHIQENIENQMTFRKKENELDDKIIKKTRKFTKTMEEKQEKETKTNAKTRQSTMDQFFGKKPQKGSARNKKSSSKAKVVGKSKASKRRMRVKEADKENRKRKTRYDDEDDESCSSQEIEVEQITTKFNKRLKLNSSQESIESNALEDSYKFSQHREPSPVINSQSSSEGSSQSDVMAEDDSPEIFKQTKADVKSAGKLKLRSKENTLECNGNEETVHEKQLPLRGKQIR